MNNLPQTENVLQEPMPAQVPAPASAAPPQKQSRLPWLVGGGLLVAMCLCVGLCLTLFIGVNAQERPALQVVDAFMQAMSKRDANQALALYSSRAQKQALLPQMQDMLRGLNFALFDQYAQVHVGEFKISPSFSAASNQPQGLLGQLSGTISYADGYTGQFQAVLELENLTWKLYNINVTAPKEKFEDYVKKNPSPAPAGADALSIVGTWTCTVEGEAFKGFETAIVTFHQDGTLDLVGRTTGKGTWKQNGNSISFQVNEYSEWTGTVTADGKAISGRISNKAGQTGTWKAVRR